MLARTPLIAHECSCDGMRGNNYNMTKSLLRREMQNAKFHRSGTFMPGGCAPMSSAVQNGLT